MMVTMLNFYNALYNPCTKSCTRYFISQNIYYNTSNNLLFNTNLFASNCKIHNFKIFYHKLCNFHNNVFTIFYLHLYCTKYCIMNFTISYL
jgi:hypothetical protein